MEVDKKCKRNGCRKAYKESENTDTACHYHDGKPIFHDLKKGWDCCNKIAWDWDEFQKLDTCQIGKHTDIDLTKGEDIFFKSDKVKQAELGIQNFQQPVQQPPKIKIKSIVDYEAQEDLKEKKKKEAIEARGKVPFVKNGKFKCLNKGCLKPYLEEENNDTACNHHSGEPCFHDLKKFWTCCKVETWDWDEFMKLPTCTVGKHIPKMVAKE